jgi:hypothetical protein
VHKVRIQVHKEHKVLKELRELRELKVHLQVLKEL